jgi:hypothetical protein
MSVELLGFPMSTSKKLLFTLPLCVLGLLGAGYCVRFLSQKVDQIINADPYTHTKPNPASLVGLYATSDRRAPRARLKILPDGRFQLSNWPGRTGSGTWEPRFEDFTRRWELFLTFDPTSPNEGPFSVSPQYLRGSSPPYEIEMFLGDPDSGPVVFLQLQSTTRPATEQNP